MSADRETLTDGDASSRSEPRSHSYLVLAAGCDRPVLRRWSLADRTEVVLSGEASASGSGSEPLVIGCSDPWASSRHAALRRSFGRWLLDDLGSKNGTTVNGERISRRELCDGDLIEIGHTAWWFRELVSDAAPPDAAIDLGDRFVTLHPPLELALRRAIAAVTAGLPVLVEGETGVGKERFVEAVHAGCGRPGALVAVNCAALPSALVEGELYGHRRGAFSGASDERTGYLRAADRGTVFLDEIGDMAPTAQAALLRVLAERSVTPVGDERPIAVDLAIVSATHRDLGAMASAGAFRTDLLARLRGISIHIPPLRERREDIGVFVARTLARAAPGAVLQVEAVRRLLTAEWPLNVREVEHVVAAAALRARGRPIAPDDLEGLTVQRAESPRPAAWSPEDEALRARLVDALATHRGNISAVARELGRDRKQIHRWIARLAIDLHDPR